MVNMLVTINILKGWETWSKMVKGLEPQMNEVGSKVLWAGCNADETAVYVLVEMKDPSYIKTFGEREDIVAIREAGGADVSSTTPIAQISNYFFAQLAPPSVAEPNNTHRTHPHWSCPWVGKCIDIEIVKDT